MFLILGLWTLMREYFVASRGRRHILHTYKIASTSYSSSPSPQLPSPFEAPLNQLISVSSLLPSRSEAPSHDEPLFPPLPTNGSVDDTAMPMNTISFGLHLSAGLAESLSIEPRDLNLFRVTTLADVGILWTDNISRHLLLTRRGQKRYVELFALPCAMQIGPHDVLREIGIRADIMLEIQLSYANLFNPEPPSTLHRYIGGVIGLPLWCWCLSCSSRRLRNRTLRKLEGQASQPPRGRGRAAALPYDPTPF